MRWPPRFDRKTIQTVLMALGSLLAAAGLAEGLVEALRYVESGTWAHHSLSWAIGAVPETTWQKLNDVLAWLWDRPFWAVTTFVGLMVALLGSSLDA